MKIYRTKEGIVIENEENFFLAKDENWDVFINDDNLPEKAKKITASTNPGGSDLINEVLAPIGSNQE
ncbi:MAG: 2-hydroxyhepta-2,4-diene-1,7-dioate isomerase, partial [Flavisolibacter sp.]|nr:2-hydroxyhepta-2,4-diene-1,7-dioate isomerase [Flavisolibacter sp.]